MARSKTTRTSRPSKPTPAKTESKTERVIALLKREGGASLAEITGATGWQPHSARAVLTGFRKKGHTISKTKADGVTRWSIAGELAA